MALPGIGEVFCLPRLLLEREPEHFGLWPPRSWLPLCLALLTCSNGKPLDHGWCVALSFMQHCKCFGKPVAVWVSERVSG